MELAAVFNRAAAIAGKAKRPAHPDIVVWGAVAGILAVNKPLVPGWHKIARLLIRGLEDLLSRAKAGDPINGPTDDPQLNIAQLQAWLDHASWRLEGSAKKVFDQFVEQRVKNTGETREQAMNWVFDTHPAAAHNYLSETTQSAAERAAKRQRTQSAQEVKGPERRTRTDPRTQK